ncbi:MAG: hypothetical protein F6K08_30535 [Okeania sp. SIO1H6]|nr:hypothetical protein [Okeania sp. SIO1H6]
MGKSKVKFSQFPTAYSFGVCRTPRGRTAIPIEPELLFPTPYSLLPK